MSSTKQQPLCPDLNVFNHTTHMVHGSRVGDHLALVGVLEVAPSCGMMSLIGCKKRNSTDSWSCWSQDLKSRSQQATLNISQGKKARHTLLIGHQSWFKDHQDPTCHATSLLNCELIQMSQFYTVSFFETVMTKVHGNHVHMLQWTVYPWLQYSR